MNNLRRVDLNLLVTLEMLLTERSVTRAARRLHLSQPSVSVQLRKLREIFADPLLVTASGSMTPTTHAQRLLPKLRAALDQLRGVVGQQASFDPANARLTLQIVAADYAEYAIVMPLLVQLRRHAPGIRLSVRQASHSKMYEQLDRGAIDLALLAMDAPPAHLQQQMLYREDYVLIARRRHPALRRKLTLDAFCALDHVVVSPDGGGFRGATDVLLENRGRSRRVQLSTQHFLFVPEIVERTDMVAVTPRRLVEQKSARLAIVDMPLRVPSYDMGMLWHDRSHSDPAHLWLREQIAQMVSN